MAQIPAAGRNQGGVELEPFFDRAAITEAVNNWGLWRDTGRWDRLRALFMPGAIMHTTWFVGPATEFVDRSIEAAKRGSRGQHFVGACSIDLNRDRAIAETRMVLLLRAPLQGVESMSRATAAPMTVSSGTRAPGASRCARTSMKKTASIRSIPRPA